MARIHSVGYELHRWGAAPHHKRLTLNQYAVGDDEPERFEIKFVDHSDPARIAYDEMMKRTHEELIAARNRGDDEAAIRAIIDQRTDEVADRTPLSRDELMKFRDDVMRTMTSHGVAFTEEQTYKIRDLINAALSEPLRRSIEGKR